MRRRNVLILAALLVATAATAQSGKRVVQTELTVADDPPLMLALRENETLVREIKGLGVLGFEPRFRKETPAVVLIVVFDAESNPHTLLGAMEVPVNGKRVESNTSPRFSLRIVRIVDSR